MPLPLEKPDQSSIGPTLASNYKCTLPSCRWMSASDFKSLPTSMQWKSASDLNTTPTSKFENIWEFTSDYIARRHSNAFTLWSPRPIQFGRWHSQCLGVSSSIFPTVQGTVQVGVQIMFYRRMQISAFWIFCKCINFACSLIIIKIFFDAFEEIPGKTFFLLETLR